MTAEPGARRGLVFACVAPHGDLAIPEACPPGLEHRAATTQGGMAELARRMDRADPDIIVVLTPHGIHVERHLAVVVAGRLAGSLDEAPAVALDVPVDRPVALAMLDELRRRGLEAVGVSYGGNDPSEAVMPLDWGTLIPLWYLGGRRRPPLPVVVVAPARDLPLADHVEAGRCVARAVEGTGRRGALVVSADQSHTHRPDGPYGFDTAAAILDERIASTVRSGRLGELLSLDPGLVDAAKPDSWWQLLMLLGAIGETWTPSLLSYEAPTYYGMLCAAFEPPP